MKFTPGLSSFCAKLLLGATSLLAMHASASVITYTDEATFQAALDSVNVINLDASPLNSYANGTSVQNAGYAASLLSMGVTFLTNTTVISGQDYQLAKPGRDRLLFNGLNSVAQGNLIIDFSTAVNGVGAWTNFIDGGKVKAWSGLNRSGNFIGEATFGSPASGGFGGLISTDLIRSVEITCDFNGDLVCGVYDIQSGANAREQTSVPESAPLALMSAALLMLLARKPRA